MSDDLKEKVKDKLLEAAINYYEAERACCELVVPQKWKDDRNNAYNEFIWRCQDYETVKDCTNIDLNKLNNKY